MKDIYENYKNDTDTIQTFTDFSGKPVTVKVGETVPILVGREEFSKPKAPSPPVVEEPEFVRIYKDK